MSYIPIYNNPLAGTIQSNPEPDRTKYDNPGNRESKDESVVNQLVSRTDDEWSGINPFETSNSLGFNVASELRYNSVPFSYEEVNGSVPEPSLLVLSTLALIGLRKWVKHK